MSSYSTEQPMSDTSDDPDLVSMVKAGDKAAFTQLVGKYQKSVFNLCFRMLNDAFAAEDAAQEVFIRAYCKLDSYDEARKFSTWLFAIASHYCLDQLKKRQLMLISWDDLPTAQHFTASSRNYPEQHLIRLESNDAIQDLLDTLPPPYRTVVILKYWNQLSCHEIAQILKSTESAVKSRLFRARQMMAQAATEQDEATQPPFRTLVATGSLS